MKTRAAFLDLDGVLIDSMPAHALAWQQMLAEYGIVEDELFFYLHEGEKAEDSVAYLLGRHGVEKTFEEQREMVERKRSIYRVMAPRGLRPEARALVDELLRRGIELSIVTGSNRHNVEKTLTPEEQALFARIITADDYDRGKPEPDPYLAAVRRSGFTKSECRVLENAPLGIRSGKAAGIMTIAIATSLPAAHLGEADAIIATFPEFLNYLDQEN